jgi:hypothetical protein
MKHTSYQNIAIANQSLEYAALRPVYLKCLYMKGLRPPTLGSQGRRTTNSASPFQILIQLLRYESILEHIPQIDLFI